MVSETVCDAYEACMLDSECVNMSRCVVREEEEFEQMSGFPGRGTPGHPPPCPFSLPESAGSPAYPIDRSA